MAGDFILGRRWLVGAGFALVFSSLSLGGYPARAEEHAASSESLRELEAASQRINQKYVDREAIERERLERQGLANGERKFKDPSPLSGDNLTNIRHLLEVLEKQDSQPAEGDKKVGTWMHFSEKPKGEILSAAYRVESSKKLESLRKLPLKIGKRISDTCEYVVAGTASDPQPQPKKVKGYSRPICRETAKCRAPVMLHGKPFRDITVYSTVNCASVDGACGTAALCAAAPAPVQDEFDIPKSDEDKNGTVTRSTEGR